jgi:hypothetical protein
MNSAANIAHTASTAWSYNSEQPASTTCVFGDSDRETGDNKSRIIGARRGGLGLLIKDFCDINWGRSYGSWK